jgi:hypothetical protein
MNAMNMPGFTAEAALLPTRRTYYKSSAKTTAQGIVVPQMRPYYEWCLANCDQQGHGWLYCHAACGRWWV